MVTRSRLKRNVKRRVSYWENSYYRDYDFPTPKSMRKEINIIKRQIKDKELNDIASARAQIRGIERAIKKRRMKKMR